MGFLTPAIPGHHVLVSALQLWELPQFLHLVRKVVDSATVKPGHKDPPDCQDVASVGPKPPQELGAKVTLGYGLK